MSTRDVCRLYRPDSEADSPAPCMVCGRPPEEHRMAIAELVQTDVLCLPVATHMDRLLANAEMAMRTRDGWAVADMVRAGPWSIFLLARPYHTRRT